MSKKKNIEMLDAANEMGMLPTLLSGLISSDSLVNADACRKSIEMLEDLREAMPESKVMDKDVWMKFISEGLEIVRKDLEKFEK
jgi:hypothetical protein